MLSIAQHLLCELPFKLSMELMDAQSMVSDGLASVRCTALRCLAKVLSAVENLVPSDAKVFTE